MTTPPAPSGPGAAQLSEAIALYESALPPGTRYQVDIAPLDVLGIPVRVDVLAAGKSWIDGIGYGASPQEARVGALGELSEFVHLNRALAADPGVEASFEVLARREGAHRVIDPRALSLPAGSPWRPDATMRWVKVRRWPDGEAFVPREFVAASNTAYRSAAAASPPPVVVPITNGCGAGVSLAQALCHGVLEIVQRDGNGTRFRAMDQGVVIDIVGVADPAIAALVARMRAAGVEPVAKLAATEFGLANLYVVDGGSDVPRFPLMATACGEAADPDAAHALRKALLEFAASRCRKTFMHGPLDMVDAVAPPGYRAAASAAADPAGDEPRALAAMLDWTGRTTQDLRALLAGTVRAQRRRIGFAALPSAPDAVRDPAARLADVAARLAAHGLSILYYDASPPGGPAVVKAIVPGLDVETMSYHRIGARGVERLAAETAPSGRILAGFGAAPAGALPVRLAPPEAERLGPAWLDVAGVDSEVGPLYPLYREPDSHVVAAVRARVSAG